MTTTAMHVVVKCQGCEARFQPGEYAVYCPIMRDMTGGTGVFCATCNDSFHHYNAQQCPYCRERWWGEYVCPRVVRFDEDLTMVVQPHHEPSRFLPGYIQRSDGTESAQGDSEDDSEDVPEATVD